MRSTYLRQISSVHTAAKPLAAQDNEEKKVWFFPQCDSVGGPLRLPLSVGMVKEEYEPSDIVSMQTHKCDQCNDEAPPAKTLMAHVLPLLLNLVASSKK